MSPPPHDGALGVASSLLRPADNGIEEYLAGLRADLASFDAPNSEDGLGPAERKFLQNARYVLATYEASSKALREGKGAE